MMSRLCLACAKSVRPRQEALQCHGCRGWQHRICTPAITREMYRATLRGEEGAIIAWCCSGCDIPTISLDESTDTALESTMVYAEDTPPVLELSAVPVAPLLCPSDTPPLLEASVTVDLVSWKSMSIKIITKYPCVTILSSTFYQSLLLLS
ncbi:uncharacterized protein LOC117322519 isoform X1 [Pecten maximus]|uniref:uncharacterized protein LOC117322519 isoform X1 n=1 Tax=Pecten maximus TaxID=6579 RepID=UPI001458227F|nr:uncharacterized protein LOC117322519 isoform X1 [Pecten maximus]